MDKTTGNMMATDNASGKMYDQDPEIRRFLDVPKAFPAKEPLKYNEAKYSLLFDDGEGAEKSRALRERWQNMYDHPIPCAIRKAKDNAENYGNKTKWEYDGAR